MRQSKISALRYIPYVAGLLALLTAALLIVYFNRKLAPGTEFDQLYSEETLTTVDEGATVEPSNPAASENIENTDIMEGAVIEPTLAEVAEEDIDTDITEEELEPETSMDEVTTPANNDRYHQLFDSASLPNLQTLSGPPPTITGDSTVDDKIRQIAEGRGYLRRPEPADVSELVLAEGSYHYLQPEASQAYLDLKAAMAAEGIIVRLTSAYRDYDRQRQIFLNNIAPPYSDENVFELLKTVSIPGYSKHHTGYAIDLGEGELTFHRFVESASYRWLSANDYENARQYGWIPSYPPGVSNQGADPEPWEFVYVGVEQATS